MDFFNEFIDFLKGNNGTWPQTFVVTSILNFRFWFFLVLIFYLYKKLQKNTFSKYIIISTIIILLLFDIELMYVRQKNENIEYKTEYYNKNTENLIIVVQGANNPFHDVLEKNKTQVDIVNSRDLDGLGFIESQLNDKKTKVLTYVGSYSYNLTPQEIFTNVYYHKITKPNGKIILVGHSLGAYNIVQVIKKLYEKKINIDLVVFLDIANKKNNSVNYFVTSNVSKVINLTSDKWSDNFYFFTNSGGMVFSQKNNKKTKIFNYHIKNTTHTTIDNLTYNFVLKIINFELKNK